MVKPRGEVKGFETVGSVLARMLCEEEETTVERHAKIAITPTDPGPVLPCADPAWASLLGRGKANETRSWATAYRGPIAIHASKRWTTAQRRLCLMNAFYRALRNGGFEDDPRSGIALPLGCIVGYAERLRECHTTNNVERIGGLSQEERLFGDYSLDRYAWVLTGYHVLAEPIPWRGCQGMFNVPRKLFPELMKGATA